MPAPPEVRQRQPAAEVGGTEVHGEDLVPDLRLEPIEGDEASRAGVVEEDVEPAEPLDCGLDHRPHLGPFGHVGPQELGTPTAGADRGRRLRAGRTIHVGEEHGGPLGGEARCRRPTDPVRRAGDDRSSPGEPHQPIGCCARKRSTRVANGLGVSRKQACPVPGRSITIL